MSFDPYYQWLGIPPDEQPADHYRLLGVRRFEQDANVIETAAERQLLLLKTRQNGPHSRLTQQLMNEVSTARLCLLNAQHKAEYDAQLQRRVSRERPTSAAANPILFDVPQDIPVLDQSWPEAPASAASDPILLGAPQGIPGLDQSWPEALESAPAASPLYPSTPLKTPAKRKRNAAGEAAEGPSLPLSLLIVLGGIVSLGIFVTVAVWLYSYAHEEPGQEPTAESSLLAELDARVPRAAPQPPPQQPGARPPQPPAPFARQGDPRASDPTTVRPPATAPQEFSKALQPFPKPPQLMPPPAGPGVSPQPVYPPGEGPAGVLNYNPGPPPGGGRPGVRYDPNTGRALPNTGMPPPVNAAPPPAMATDRPLEFDLSAAIAANGLESILVTQQLPAVDATWEVLLEDYSSPRGQTRFTIGAVTTVDGIARWPITCQATGDAVAAETESSGEGAAAQTQLADLEAGPSGLFLKFASSATPQLIEPFCYCMLDFRKLTARHRIQLSAPETTAPLVLGLEEAKATIGLDGLPAALLVAADRIRLEVLRVDIGDVQSPTVSLRGALNKEVAIPLDSHLECEMGIRLAEANGQYDLVLMPRYMLNDRRQALVPTEVQKDLKQAQSRFAKNERDLNEAQQSLLALPREVKRVRQLDPQSPQESAVIQLRMSQLEQLGNNLRKTISRHNEGLPKQAMAIERLGSILTLLGDLSSRSALHFRIVAEGEAGDFVLLQTSTNY